MRQFLKPLTAVALMSALAAGTAFAQNAGNAPAAESQGKPKRLLPAKPANKPAEQRPAAAAGEQRQPKAEAAAGQQPRKPKAEAAAGQQPKAEAAAGQQPKAEAAAGQQPRKPKAEATAGQRKGEAAPQRTANAPSEKDGKTTNVTVTNEQKTVIRNVVRETNVEPQHIDFAISLGVAVPTTVHYYPLPPRVVEIVPAYSGYDYFVLADGRIIIIDPVTLQVVYILA